MTRLIHMLIAALLASAWVSVRGGAAAAGLHGQVPRSGCMRGGERGGDQPGLRRKGELRPRLRRRGVGHRPRRLSRSLPQNPVQPAGCHRGRRSILHTECARLRGAEHQPAADSSLGQLPV